MRFLSLSVVFCAIMLNYSPISAQSDSLISKLVEMNGRKLLYGSVSVPQLFYDFPVWKKIYDSYTPESSTLDSLRTRIAGREIQFLVFLGTWCGDSRREVPKFLNVLDRCGVSRTTIQLFGVDGQKKMEGNMIQDYAITRVPTIILLQNNKETGRITEYVKKSMEADLLKLLLDTE